MGELLGCFCVQGFVEPARGEGVEQFVPGVSGIRGDTVHPLLESVLDGPDGNHCMFITTCNRLLDVCTDLHCLFSQS